MVNQQCRSHFWSSKSILNELKIKIGKNNNNEKNEIKWTNNILNVGQRSKYLYETKIIKLKYWEIRQKSANGHFLSQGYH